jgi:hypothetical protein
MRWMTLTVLGVACVAVGAQAQPEPRQATLRLGDASVAWIPPGSVNCEMINSLRGLTVTQNGEPYVPDNDAGIHGTTPNHSQTQRVAHDGGGSGTDTFVIRLDGKQLAAAMAMHHERSGVTFIPKQYKVQAFAGLPNARTNDRNVRIAKSPSLDVPAAALNSGRIVLIGSLPEMVRGASAPVTLVIRATATNHVHESPQLVCTLTP